MKNEGDEVLKKRKRIHRTCCTAFINFPSFQSALENTDLKSQQPEKIEIYKCTILLVVDVFVFIVVVIVVIV